MSSCHSDTQTSETEDDYMNAINNSTYQLAQPVVSTTLAPPLFPFPPPFDPQLLPLFPPLSNAPPNSTPGELNPPPLLMPPFPFDPNNPMFMPPPEQLPPQQRIPPTDMGNMPMGSPSEQSIRPPFQHIDPSNLPQFQPPDQNNLLPMPTPEMSVNLAQFQPPPVSATPPLFQPLSDQQNLPVSHIQSNQQFQSPELIGVPNHFHSDHSNRPFQPPNQPQFPATSEPTNSHFPPPADLAGRPHFLPPDMQNRPPFPNPDPPSQRPPPPIEHPLPPLDPPNLTHFPNSDPSFQPADLNMRNPLNHSNPPMFQLPTDPQMQPRFQGFSEPHNRTSDPNLPPLVQPNQPRFQPPETRNREHFVPPAPPIRSPFQPPSDPPVWGRRSPSEHSEHPSDPSGPPRFRIPSTHNFPEPKPEAPVRDPNNVQHFQPPETLPPNMQHFPTPPFTSPPPNPPPPPNSERFPSEHREVDLIASPKSDPNIDPKDSPQFTPPPPNHPFLSNHPDNNRPPEPWMLQQNQNLPHPQFSFQEPLPSLSPSKERTPDRSEQIPLAHESSQGQISPEQVGTQAPAKLDSRPPFDIGNEQGPVRPMNLHHGMPFNHPDGMEFEPELQPNFHDPHYHHPMHHHGPPLDQPFIRPPFHRPRMLGPPPREPFYPPFHMGRPLRHHNHRPPQQMGHIPFRPAWSEHVTADGRVYYYNHQTLQSMWERPNDFEGDPPPMFHTPVHMEPEQEVPMEGKKTEIEPREEPGQPAGTKPINSTPVPGTEWCVVWTNDNKVFFFNPVLNKSVWLLPTELKEHPIARKLMERNPDLPALLNPAPVESTPKRAKIEPEVVLEEEKSSDDESDDTEVSKGVEIILQQPIKKQGKKAKEVKTDTLVSEAEAKALRSTRPIESRVAEYKEMLLQRGVSAFSTWEKEQPKVAFDPRYVLLTAKERKSVFDQFTQERIHEEKREKNLKLKQKRDKFFSLLQDAKVGPKSSFHEFMLKWSKEPRFKEIERLKERESLFIEFQSNLKKKTKIQTKSFSETIPETRQVPDEKDLKQNRIQASLREREREVYESRRNQERDLEDQRNIHKRDEAKTQYKALLTEMVKDSRTNFKSFEKILRENPDNDEFYESLSRDERQIQFENHLDHLQNKKRLQFQACIDECAEIDYSTTWKRARKLLKSDPRLEAVSSSETKQETEYLRYIESKSKRAREEFLQLLKETKLITHKTELNMKHNPKELKEIHGLLAKDRRYLDLDCVSEDRSQMLQSYVSELSKKGTPPPPTATSPNRARLK